MILYHGSNMPIETIDLGRCRPYKDFGRGFYLTSLKHQAENMAKRTVRLQGTGDSTVTVFELADDWKERDLRILRFEEPSRRWAQFIVNNRDRNFADLAHPDCNQMNPYDIVYGPVANDAIVASFQLYHDGRIDIDELVKRFEYRDLSDQYSFHTSRALEVLTPIGTLS